MHSPRSLVSLLVLSAAITLSACAADGATPGTNTPVAGPKSDIVSLSASAEARHVDVAELADFVPPDGLLAEPGRKVMSTPDSFRRFFGVDAPTSVDFDNQWVVFFTPGPQQERGQFDANVKITVHPSGDSLRVGREVLEPGRGCFKSDGPTPYYVGAFTPPTGIRPQSVRYFTRTRSHECDTIEPLCGPPLMEELKGAAILPNGDEILYLSEADYPFVAVDLGPVGEGTIETSGVAYRAVEGGLWDDVLTNIAEWGDEEVPGTAEGIVNKLLRGDGIYWRASDDEFGGFFDGAEWELPLSEVMEFDEWDRNEILGNRQLHQAMTDNLTDIHIYRFFDVEVHILIVGRTACGRLVGYQTISIET